MNEPQQNFWLGSNGLAAIGLIGGVLYFLLTEHRAHFIYALPYLIFLLCPLMHVFMHRGHDGHQTHSRHGIPPDSPDDPSRTEGK